MRRPDLDDRRVHLPGDCSLSYLLAGAWARQAFSRRIKIEEGAHDHGHLVTFQDLPQHIELALEVIGESLRIPEARAMVEGHRMSSLVALWNRLDRYRQSLAIADRQAFCRNKAASLLLSSESGTASCAADCQFLCRQCTLIDGHPAVSLIHPGTHGLAVLGEIGWCLNLRRSAHLEK